MGVLSCEVNGKLTRTDFVKRCVLSSLLNLRFLLVIFPLYYKQKGTTNRNYFPIYSFNTKCQKRQFYNWLALSACLLLQDESGTEQYHDL